MDTSAILANNWLGILSTTGNLGLLFLLLRRAQPSPMRLPLVLLCFTMTVWSFCAAMWDLFEIHAWHWLEVTVAPFMVPLALHVVLAYGGRRRRHAWFLRGMYALFAMLSVAGGVKP